MIKALLLATILFISNTESSRCASHIARRLPRNICWWQTVLKTYSEKRFKQTFRVSRKTFNFLLPGIHHNSERQTLCEEPVSPEFRLAICLYHLERCDSFYSIAEVVGLGRSTVATIVNDVSEAIVSCLWKECVVSLMPNTEQEFKDKIMDMEELWKFPYRWAAVDSCHIAIKCPPGGSIAR